MDLLRERLRETNPRSIIIFLLTLVLVLFATQVYLDVPAGELKKQYANEHSRFIVIDGTAVHYRLEGAGYPLVLIHGTASSLHTWDGWVAELSKGFRILRMDLPAFGLTGPNRNHDYSITAYVALIDTLVKELGFGRFHLAGNSLGGNIAWNYTATHPEKVNRLILIDSSGYLQAGGTPWIFRAARTPGLSFLVRWITPPSIIRRNLVEVYGDDSKITDELVERYHRLMLREGNRDAFIARSGLVQTFPTGRLTTLQAPTLIMWGTADAWISVKNAHRFKKDIPNSRLVLYEGVGHVPMEEIPVRSAADARRFLAGTGMK